MITKVQSLTLIETPVRTPFGYSAIPLIHMDNPSLFPNDKEAILRDERFVYNLIDSAATSLVIVAKTKENIDINESRNLTNAVDSLLQHYNLTEKLIYLVEHIFKGN